MPADIIFSEEIKVKNSEGFNNIDLGNWENKLKSEIETKYLDLRSTWLRQLEKLSFSGFESIQQVRERSYSTSMNIKKN
jgi:broad specificity phosphatase PhoE